MKALEEPSFHYQIVKLRQFQKKLFQKEDPVLAGFYGRHNLAIDYFL